MGLGRDSGDADRPRDVILLVGDGMGMEEITAARYYQGAESELNVDRLPNTGFGTTWSVHSDGGPDYNPDSAATATMWATGEKTIDERLSRGPGSSADEIGAELETVLEIAQQGGMKVGSISTAWLTDATPAAIASHVSSRTCAGPEEMEDCPEETKAAGGLGSIAEQEVDHEVDVLLGGGRDQFEQTIEAGPEAGRTVLEAARDKGYRYVTDTAELDAIPNGERPVLGLFASGEMSPEWSGPVAATGKGAGPVACSEDQRPDDDPSLAAMTERAIELLEGGEGFFLQVEGASIDKMAHTADACGQIGETLAFDEAVGVALEYQRREPEALVVVTADHAHSTQIVADDASGSGLPTGYSTNLTTRDGETLTLTYGTAGYGGPGAPPATPPPAQQHSGAAVPVWAAGPGSEAVLGTNDQTDLFELLGD